MVTKKKMANFKRKVLVKPREFELQFKRYPDNDYGNLMEIIRNCLQFHYDPLSYEEIVLSNPFFMSEIIVKDFMTMMEDFFKKFSYNKFQKIYAIERLISEVDDYGILTLMVWKDLKNVDDEIIEIYRDKFKSFAISLKEQLHRRHFSLVFPNSTFGDKEDVDTSVINAVLKMYKEEKTSLLKATISCTKRFFPYLADDALKKKAEAIRNKINTKGLRKFD